MRNRIFVFLVIFFSFINNVNAQWKKVLSKGESVMTIVTSGKDVFAGTLGGGFFSSTDEGDSWTVRNSGLPGHNPFVMAACNMGSRTIVATPEHGMFISLDYAANWREVERGYKKHQVNTFLKQGKKIYAGTIGMVLLSTDSGTSWVGRNAGLGDMTVEALAIAKNRMYAGTKENGIYTSDDNGINWIENGMKGKWINCLAVIDSVVFAGTQGDGVFISTGGEWKAANEGLKDSLSDKQLQDLVDELASLGLTPDKPPSTGPNVYAIAVSGKTIYAGTRSGIFRSLDYGKTWNDVSGELKGEPVLCIAINNNYMYVSSTDGIWRRPLKDLLHH